MNKYERNNFALNHSKKLKGKADTLFRLNKQNNLGYFTGTVIFLTLLIKIISPVEIAKSEPLVKNSWEKKTSQALIIAQEEEPEAELGEEPTEAEAEAELGEEPAETEAEAELGEEPTEAEAESELGEEPAETEAEAESELGEEPTEAEAELGEEPAETEAEAESELGEEPTEAEAEEKLSIEAEKETLEEKIDEHYEEWKSRKTSVQISHSFTAITTIILTIVITLIGTGLFVVPSGRILVMILGVIAVLIQLHSNIFLLGKSLGGYRVLEEQGLIIKEQLETVETEEELEELNELFNELVLDSINLE